MARAIFVNGPTLVTANGNELGLADAPITVSLTIDHEDVKADAWGNGTFDVQFMSAEMTVSMNLIHFDRTVLDTCVANAMATANIGQLAGGGSLLRGTGSLISLRLTSPIAAKPWTFPNAFLHQAPMRFPLGTSKSVVQLNWRVIPSIADPYNGGAGSAGFVLWSYT